MNRISAKHAYLTNEIRLAREAYYLEVARLRLHQVKQAAVAAIDRVERNIKLNRDKGRYIDIDC